MFWDAPCRRLKKLRVRNPLDGQWQPNLVGLPTGSTVGRPVVVFCHKWGETYRQFDPELADRAQQAGWLFLAPHYRGKNDRPESGGSELALQDVISAIDAVVARFAGDPTRVALVGLSGGGHMALLLAARFPQRFVSVSVWSAIGRLADWHRFHRHRRSFYPYWKDIESITGGPPGASSEVDEQYRRRSPTEQIEQAGQLPIDINHGLRDGHGGHTISIEQSIDVFNALARHAHATGVSPQEREYLLSAGASGRIDPLDAVSDPQYPTTIYLRRQAGRARLTIFEGAHDIIPSAAIDWVGRSLNS
jgi:dipeptidyl aminopeptidase/acylaminoacyl peptidase